MDQFSRYPGGIAGRAGRKTPSDAGRKDPERVPSLVVVAAAILTFVVGIMNFAFGQVSLGVGAVALGLLIFGAGLSWLSMERRRVREAERGSPFNGSAR
jgi:hypothetical protein